MMNGDMRYAGFWIRCAAAAIDTVLLLVILLPLLVWIYGLEYFESQSVLRGPMDFLISYVFPTIAVILFWRYRAATPGKMLLRLHIVDARTGGKPNTPQCVLRYFAYLVSSIPFGLGFLWIAFDRRKQAWHDKLAKTIVVRGRQ